MVAVVVASAAVVVASAVAGDVDEA